MSTKKSKNKVFASLFSFTQSLSRCCSKKSERVIAAKGSQQGETPKSTPISKEANMQSKIKNDFGTIAVENEVIARIAGLSAMECYGVVGMAAKSIKDGLVHLLKIESLSKGVKIDTLENGGLVIDLHIIVEYGTNLVAIANTLKDNVRYKVEESVGMTVQDVNIYIEGIRID
jgi:uncharacterized alkaline shock family protein YloU